MEAANNASLIPSARDLLLVLPRLAQRASSFALFHVPEAVDSIAGKIFSGGSFVADATAQQTSTDSTITNMSAAVAQSTASILDSTIREAWADGTNEASSSLFVTVAQGIGKIKNFGGIFSYLTSKWALTTFTAAIILNRAQFYASSREHLHLRWYMRLALYAIPIAAFLAQLLSILQSMKCQTSPDFAELRYGDPLKHLAIDFGGEGGFLYWLSSSLLFWEDDASCCQAREMSLVGLTDDKAALRGSMSLLLRFFLTLCTSQLFETLCCALQGKQPMPETGMTIFEHSLAFAECETMISSALGFGLFGLKAGGSSPTSEGGTTSLIGRSEILQRLNVPPEVLLVCLISCFSHLSSATLAILGVRHKVRLVNTAIWACCYMSSFLWSFAKIFMSPLDHIADLGVLRFPTVCVVGFIPHLLILVGICVCAVIYSLAIFITALSIPPNAAKGLSFRQRLAWAYNNLQANVQFSQNSSIRIKMSEDFYTTLLKTGFNVLTAASEAVYLNEGSRIHIAEMTWLERKRINEIALSVENHKRTTIPVELLDEGIARGVGFIDTQNSAISQSPYARERKSQPPKSDIDRQNVAGLDSGLGIVQRRSRMQLTFDFLAGIFWLVVGLQARLMLNALRKLGLDYRPAWMLRAAGMAEGPQRPSAHNRRNQNSLLDFYLINDDGNVSIPADHNFDVEAETRRRIQRSGEYRNEQQVGDEVYGWWRKGGRFGDLDESGDYQVPHEYDDDDLTSMLSMSTNASITGDEDADPRRTPTPRDYYGQSVSSTENDVDLSSLSRLLNPQSSADREEARLLSYRLQTNRPMTRSQYRRTADRSRARILDGLRGSGRSESLPPTEEEEERDLECFVLAQRSSKASVRARTDPSGSWELGAEGMGAGGPMCVVCQSTPRTILVWPCGCLSMCDDCRVGLAARNYTKCICCRTDIAAYSRLYVP